MLSWMLQLLLLTSLQDKGDGFCSFSSYCSSASSSSSSSLTLFPEFSFHHLTAGNSLYQRDSHFRLYVATDKPTTQKQMPPSFTIPPISAKQPPHSTPSSSSSSSSSHSQERFAYRLKPAGYGKTKHKKKINYTKWGKIQI